MYQTAPNHLYVTGVSTSSRVATFHSATEGRTWIEIDNPGPSGADTDSSSCAIDGIDDIHVSFWDAGVGSRYVIFDMSTQTWGTAETAFAETGSPARGMSGITVDSANKPHVLTHNFFNTRKYFTGLYFFVEF